MPSPQKPSFDLHGFQVHEGGHDTNVDETPMYLPETDKLRAMALIRFTPDFDGTCEVYELATMVDPQKRIGPLPIFMDPDPSNTFPVKAKAQIKVIAGLADADDVKERHLGIDVTSPTIGVACVPDGTDGTVLYSELYSALAPLYQEQVKA